MINPLSIASGGYLTGVAIDLAAIHSDGYLTSVIMKRRGGGKAREEDPYLEFLRREDEELMLILTAWIMEIGNG